MKTRAELINQVLINLGKLTNGAAEAEDVAKVDVVIDGSFDDLSARDIYYVQDGGIEGPDGGAIEDAAFLDLCHVVALQAAPAFAMAADQTLLGWSDRAEAHLRTKTAPSRGKRLLSVDPALRTYRRGYYRIP